MPFILTSDEIPGASIWSDSTELFPPASGQVSIVWSPDKDTDAASSRFRTWEEVYVYLSAQPAGLKYIIYFDTSSTEAFVFPPGVYELRNAVFDVTYVNPGLGLSYQVTIPDGVILSNLVGLNGIALLLAEDATQTAITFSGLSVFSLSSDAALVNQSAAGGVFIRVVDLSALVFFLSRSSFGFPSPFPAPGASPVLQVETLGQCLFTLSEGSFLRENTIQTLDAGVVVNAQLSAGSTVFEPQIGAGTVSSVLTEKGSNVEYTPGDGADWADPDPTTVAEALDRLAAANPGA